MSRVGGFGVLVAVARGVGVEPVHVIKRGP